MKNYKILCGLAAIAVVVAAILGVLGIVDVETILGAGAMMAAAPAVGFEGATAAQTHISSSPTAGGEPVTTGKSGVSPEDKPQMNKATVSEKLSRIEPSRTPLDTLLRNIGTGKTNSDVFEFYSIHSRGLSATVASATADGDIIKITLSDGGHCLSKDANVFVPQLQVTGENVAAASPIATNPLRLHIVDIKYGGTPSIDVIVVNEGVTAAKAATALTSGVILRRMASAKDQEAAISNDPMATPVKDKNYCQRNLCTISQNVYQALQDKEVEYGIAEFKEQALLDFRAQAEYAAIFGDAPAGGSIVDPNTQKRKLFMRGLLSFDVMKYTQGEESIEEYLNIAMQKAFENNNGSEKRLLLYGPEFATALANSKVWTHQLEAGKTDVKWGITWKVIESNFGTLMAIMHPGLGAVGYGKAALLIDPANIRRIEQVPLTMENLDLKKAGIRNSEDVLLEESFTIEVTNPKTHGFLCLK